jgi:hypothetical protein
MFVLSQSCGSVSVSIDFWKITVKLGAIWLAIRENGVEKLLQDINPSKASGPDGISNCILKKCASQIAPSLTVIFQKSIDTETSIVCFHEVVECD